jgi:hypothetical protein
MEIKKFGQRSPVVWFVNVPIVATLVTVVVGWPWLRRTSAWSYHALLPAVVVGSTVFLCFVWQSRVRAARRWNAILNAYAEREMGRHRRRGVPTTVAVDGRNSQTAQTLKDRLAEELTELAYPVILQQGVQAFSVDVELAIWKAIDGTLQEMLQPMRGKTVQTPPVWGIVLRQLTKTVYQTVRRHEFQGTFRDVEFGLWDAFHSEDFRGHAGDRLPAFFRRTWEAFEAQPGSAADPGLGQRTC